MDAIFLWLLLKIEKYFLQKKKIRNLKLSIDTLKQEQLNNSVTPSAARLPWLFKKFTLPKIHESNVSYLIFVQAKKKTSKFSINYIQSNQGKQNPPQFYLKKSTHNFIWCGMWVNFIWRKMLSWRKKHRIWWYRHSEYNLPTISLILDMDIELILFKSINPLALHWKHGHAVLW